MNRFTYEVLRLTMEDWHTRAPFDFRDPIPVILAYTSTNKLGSVSTEQTSVPILLGDMPESKSYEDDNLLQRVRINSIHLHKELSTITGIAFKFIPLL